jgi:hypothetical protein
MKTLLLLALVAFKPTVRVVTKANPKPMKNSFSLTMLCAVIVPASLLIGADQKDGPATLLPPEHVNDFLMADVEARDIITALQVAQNRLQVAFDILTADCAKVGKVPGRGDRAHGLVCVNQPAPKK